jgi:hypothetical protein
MLARIERFPRWLACTTLLLASAPCSTRADDSVQSLKLADGKIELMAPADWKTKQPNVSMIEAEFVVPKSDGDAADGRVTVMAAGGGLEANVQRWRGQFDNKTHDKLTRIDVGDQVVHLVDLAGTFKDQRGPFAPATMRKGYRMLGAVIPTADYGQYFIKFYGPSATVAAQEKAFQKMIRSLKIR